MPKLHKGHWLLVLAKREADNIDLYTFDSVSSRSSERTTVLNNVEALLRSAYQDKLKIRFLKPFGRNIVKVNARTFVIFF